MANTFNALFNRVAVTTGAVVAATSFAAPAALAQDTLINIAGSSTVFPITSAMAEEFFTAEGIPVVVNSTGTGGGFSLFCSDNVAERTAISNASRPIKDSEAEKCEGNEIGFIEIPVAYDALTVVVDKENNVVTDLSIEQLARLFDSAFEDEATTWADLDPTWPAVAIDLAAPGTDSGTFDYFVEAVLEDFEGVEVTVEETRATFTGTGESRQPALASEDDNALVNAVAGAPGDSDITHALGYFGFSYFAANEARLNAVSIEGVAPSRANVENGTYTPFSREIYIYVSTTALERPEVQEFVQFYLDNLTTIVPEVDYVNLPQSLLDAGQTTLDEAIAALDEGE
ncbi:MAG: PstS family phosphate ABC transporter substrate-binding protein [Cyanothece sp. SIO2G6]|nr:PstS family phosphate ABC transporter substrate-binding protein [Cyanothece sp. SIO2G6]